MKIGIISDWINNLYLMKYLTKFQHEFFFLYDQKNWNYWNYKFEESIKIVEDWIKKLQKKWIQKIIVSPAFELHFDLNWKYQNLIIPVFRKYLVEYCFKYSLVGKFWIIWEYWYLENIQNDLDTIKEKYFFLTENQKKTKNFNSQFKYRKKEPKIRKEFLEKFSFGNYLVNKVVKFDLKYFKDANIDTIIPLDYWYFAFQKTIFNYLNTNKYRFHKIEKIIEILDSELSENQTQYSFELLVNWHDEFLKRDKKRSYFY